MKTCPSAHWRVCCFIRMCNTLVQKIHSIALAKRNLLIPFSNVFDLYNQYYSILPPQTRDFKVKSLKEAPEDIGKSVASWGCIILWYLFLMCLNFIINSIAFYLPKHQILKWNHLNRPQRKLLCLLLHEDI